MDARNLALCQIIGIVNEHEQAGHALNCLDEIRAIAQRVLAPCPQIPREELVEGTWYAGRGRANVALWGWVGRGDRRRLTFLTIALVSHQPNEGRGSYMPIDDGCFQPFRAIAEGTVAEAMGMGTAARDNHCAKLLEI